MCCAAQHVCQQPESRAVDAGKSQQRAGVLDHENGLTLSERLTPTMVALPHRGIVHVKRNTSRCFSYAILFPCTKGVRLTVKTPGVEQGGMPADSSASSHAMNKHLGELTTAVHSLKRKVEKMQEDTDDAHQTLKSLADQLKPLCECAKNISQNPSSHSRKHNQCHRGPCNRHHFLTCLLHGSSEALTGYTAHTAKHCIIHSELCCICLLCSSLCRMCVSLHFNSCGTHF